VLTSAWGGRGQTSRRGWAVLATLAVVASLLFVGAANPPSALGAPGSNTANFSFVINGPVAAGTPFMVTVTARDSRGRTVNSFVGPASLSGLAPSPNGSMPVQPDLTVWDNGVSTTMVIAKKSQTGARLTATATVDGAVVSSRSDPFSVVPSSATSLAFADTGNEFNGQPVDAEFDTPITSSLTADDPVKVIALDSFGNRVGGVSVTLSSSPDSPTDTRDDLQGTKTISTNSSDAFGIAEYGEASFDDLAITKYGRYQLIATAGTLTTTSTSFEIVADLAKCTRSPCKSTGRSAGVNLQITYSSLTATALDDVILTTAFIGDASGVECANPGDAFGELTEVRVQGGGVTESEPAFQVAMIVPKTTLQALDLTSRSADSFNMCLGATRLDGGSGGWRGRTTIGGEIVTLTDPDNDGVYWGFVADCSTPNLGASPCVSLKTKNAGQLQAELLMTKAEFKALGFASSDLAVVIRKPFPWDGKGGLY
jgi:hypothetical protein